MSVFRATLCVSPCAPALSSLTRWPLPVSTNSNLQSGYGRLSNSTCRDCGAHTVCFWDRLYFPHVPCARSTIRLHNFVPGITALRTQTLKKGAAGDSMIYNDRVHHLPKRIRKEVKTWRRGDVNGKQSAARGSQECHSLPSTECINTKSATQKYIQSVYSAMGLQDIAPNETITVSGVQTFLGMEGKWKLKWNMDGQFYERFDGVEMTCEWAYDGRHDPWCADASGHVSTMDLDDREVCLLTLWVRTGYWLTQKAQHQLHIELEEEFSTMIEHASPSELMFSVSLKDSKTDRMCLFPFSSVHAPPPGGKDLYFVGNVKVEENAEGNGASQSVYVLPDPPMVQRHNPIYPHAYMDSSHLPSVEMIRAESGHYLVRPLIDGRDIGYFVVDTGASSLTITPHKAKELGMDAFGDVHITCVEGQVKSQYRRAKNFKLGPLSITAPLFLEVPMEGVVRGKSPVAGICGYDIFHHCIVEMAYSKGRLSLFDQLAYKAPQSGALDWHAMSMIENVPHVSATFNGQVAIFMLDTGAGGVDIIFHGRAVEQFGLLKSVWPGGTASVKGISAASTEGIEVKFGTLETLELAGVSFKQVRALFTAKNTGALDLSVYTAGVLCGDLLAKFVVVFDYRNRRLAFVAQ